MEKIVLKILGNPKDFEEYGLNSMLNEILRNYGIKIDTFFVGSHSNTSIKIPDGWTTVFPLRFLRYEGQEYRDKLQKILEQEKIPHLNDNQNHLWMYFPGEEWRRGVRFLKNRFPEIQYPSVQPIRSRFFLSHNGKTLNLLVSPKIMGIVNVTPDSFSDGGLFIDPERAIEHILELINEGADIIDIGAESTRPGSPRISAEEEWNRLKPVLELITQEQIHKKVWISLDTYKSNVAEEALKYEVDIINDISAGSMDPRMMDVVGAAKCPYIMMHMKGTPESMQNNPKYNHVMDEIIDFFEEKIREAEQKGIEQLILDPGIGFGKRLEDNYEIIRRLEELTGLGYPVLLGASRKSFLWKKLKIEPKAADNSTTIVDLLGIQNRAHIIRVHNVKKHREMLTVFGWIRQLKAT